MAKKERALILPKETPLDRERVQFTSVLSLSHVWLFATPWTAARQASVSFTNSWSLLKLMSVESVMPSNHLILCCPLSSHLQSFLASGSFQMSQLFPSGGQSIGVSFSISPSNEYSGLISFRMDWLYLLAVQMTLQESYNTVQKHQFLGIQLSL